MFLKLCRTPVWGCFLLLAALALLSSAKAEVIEELIRNQAGSALPYQPAAQSVSALNLFPGRIVGQPEQQGEASFTYAWPHRQETYELHFESAEQLARSIYALAVYAMDISPDTPRERFYRGVSGFHYSLDQICAFAGMAERKGLVLTDEERKLLADLEEHGVIAKDGADFKAAGSIGHVLGAAPGKKRSFAQNLRHERLHVYWDADDAFRTQWQQRWKELTESERAAVFKKLKNYNQDNLPQLIEEWAVGEAEQQPLPDLT